MNTTLRIWLGSLVFYSLLLLNCTAPTPQHPVDAALQTLDSIRQEKQAKLADYLCGVQHQAHNIQNDTLMQSFFTLKNRYYTLGKTTPPPPAMVGAIEKLKGAIRAHYLKHYLSFYDILCINRQGDIFYTIRTQADYHKNIFDSTLCSTSLARNIKQMPHETFVDFEYYHISDEPSAFFIEPVMDQDSVCGWFALQFSINRINAMLSAPKGPGATGESILVNRDRYLLTNSRFFAPSTILRRRLPEENIAAKFAERCGNKIVTDYRGYSVLSSFSVCPVLDSTWLLIVKMNQSEVLTDYYRHQQSLLRAPILDTAATFAPTPCSAALDSAQTMREVDMDEFRRADSATTIYTHGVSTCTAVLIYLPGRFAYLAHLSVDDRLAGGSRTDLVASMINTIKEFDVNRYERQQLKVIIAAPHQRHSDAIVNYLVDEGLFLSQIHLASHPTASYLNIYHDYRRSATLINWFDSSAKALLCQNAAALPSLEAALNTMLPARQAAAPRCQPAVNELTRCSTPAHHRTHQP
jgi:hypothetical protein